MQELTIAKDIQPCVHVAKDGHTVLTANTGKAIKNAIAIFLKKGDNIAIYNILLMQ